MRLLTGTILGPWAALCRRTCIAGVTVFFSTSAVAADAQATGPSEGLFLVQIAVLLLVGRLLGEAMQRLGQPAVMGQLIGGLLLGPSVLGALWPAAEHAIFPAIPEQKSMTAAVSQLGVLMLLMLTGMETDLKLVRKVGRAAVSVSIGGVCLPFACGFILGQSLPDALLPGPDRRLIGSLFLGTALSISSVKVVAMVVREMNFMRRNVGQVIIASAIIDDTIGWIVIAVTFSLAAHGAVDATSIAESVLGTVLFLVISLTIGRRVVFSLIRWANDNLVSELPVISVILLLMIGMALITSVIGVQSVLGAFVAGVLVGELPILTRHIDQQLRGLIMGLFMPVFFGLAGLSADLTILREPALLALTGGLIAIASLGKFAGAFLGGKLGRLSLRESLALAFAMNARGSTEVIVATIGLSMGVLSQNLFTMIVAMAVGTTMAMPPMLRWALARLPLGKEEKNRLEREEFEARGFVANLERFLLAVDESPNGRFASRITGLIAGTRGIPTTVLHIGPDAKRQEQMRGSEASVESAVKAGGAEATATIEGEDKKPKTVDVITRAKTARTEEAIASEARRGYDLLVIGVEKVGAPEGGFHKEISRTAANFEGPVAVVAALGPHLERPAESSFRILVPVTGTDVSRRAAEVAVALARSSDAQIAALYVSSPGGPGSGRALARGIAAMRRHEEAILKDVVALGERYDVDIRTAVRVNSSADNAILKAARDGRYNLIVMGVGRRPGDTLFFGNVAATVLQKTSCSVLFVAS